MHNLKCGVCVCVCVCVTKKGGGVSNKGIYVISE